MYEGGIRVPGMVRWPGHVKPGQVSGEPVCGTDILPTFCAITGLDVPSDRAIDGASILPALSGGKVERSVPLYWQYNLALSQPKAAMRQGDWKLLAALTVQDGLEVSSRFTDEQFEAMKAAKLRDFELYNVREDMSETTDLTQREPRKLKEMAEAMTAMFEEVKAESPLWPEFEDPEQRFPLFPESENPHYKKQ